VTDDGLKFPAHSFTQVETYRKPNYLADKWGAITSKFAKVHSRDNVCSLPTRKNMYFLLQAYFKYNTYVVSSNKEQDC